MFGVLVIAGSIGAHEPIWVWVPMSLVFIAPGVAVLIRMRDRAATVPALLGLGAAWFVFWMGAGVVALTISEHDPADEAAVGVVLMVAAAVGMIATRINRVRTARARRAQIDAQIARRADGQHAAALRGEDWGVYGIRTPPVWATRR